VKHKKTFSQAFICQINSSGSIIHETRKLQGLLYRKLATSLDFDVVISSKFER
jgi:hypothetical protein